MPEYIFVLFKFTTKTLGKRHLTSYSLFIVNLEHTVSFQSALFNKMIFFGKNTKNLRLNYVN